MPQPTVVLVHGAFADSASYAPVTRRLLDAGIPVVVPAVPNRSLLGDCAYIASVVRQIDGPVLLVGHSYRLIVPLSAILGAAFLATVDIGARTLVAPAELPVGVITAFVGAPFFCVVLWRRKVDS